MSYIIWTTKPNSNVPHRMFQTREEALAVVKQLLTADQKGVYYVCYAETKHTLGEPPVVTEIVKFDPPNVPLLAQAEAALSGKP